MHPLIILIQILAALYIITEGVLALNRMGPHTAHRVRLTYLALTAGAVGVLVYAFGSPNKYQLLLVLGMAGYLAFDRRRRTRSST